MGYGIDTYTKLLLHCDGANGSTTFVDSATGKAITAVADAKIDTSQKVFGTGSAKVDGTGDCLTALDSADWHYGSDNFTIDFRFRWNGAPSGYATFVSQDADSTHRFSFQYLKTTNLMLFRVYNGGAAIIDHQKSFTASGDTWYHIALVRYGNVFTTYVAGTSLGDTTDDSAIPDFVGLLYIGAGATYGENANGWFDEFRISKGIARWTADFTPPTSAHTLAYNFIPKEILKTNLYPSTALKMYHQFEGNSTDTTANDHDGTDTDITYGNDYGVFNQGALFNGTSSKIVIVNHADLRPAGAFTLGCWVKNNVATGDIPIVSNIWWDGSNIQGWMLCCNFFRVGKGAGWNVDVGYTNLDLPYAGGNWQHIVITMTAAGIARGYINGSFYPTNNRFLLYGAMLPTYHASSICQFGYTNAYYPGSIDDFFLLNGVCLTAEQVYYLYNHRSVGVIK